MRTHRAIVVAALALLLLAPSANASAASSGDFVVGIGFRLSQDGATRQVLFSVVAGARGGQAGGTYSGKWLNGELTLVGRVTCLDIQDNAVAVGGVITRGSGDGAGWVGGPFLVYFVDGGALSHGGFGADIVSQTYVPYQFLYGDAEPAEQMAVVPLDFPSTCPAAMTLDALAAAGEARPVLGSVVVKDR